MKERIKRQMINYIKSNYAKLNDDRFINGKTYFNSACHINSVQNAYDNKYRVLLCVCVNVHRNDLFVHFINQDNKGNYIDGTLGWYGKSRYDYYLIKEVHESEYINVDNLLTSTKQSIININTNVFQRIFKIITEDEI